MKRSDAIKRIQWIIDDNGHRDSSILADLILDTLEEDVGMKAPIKNKCAIFFIDAYSWESEDDKLEIRDKNVRL